MSNANQKTQSKTKAMIPATLRRDRLFGRPPLLEGEDPAAYDELFDGIHAAVKPVDIVDEMLVADVVALEWQAVRWRRLKSTLLRMGQSEALAGFLDEKMRYHLYAKDFEDDLATTLRDILPSAQADSVEQLARACAQKDAGAADEIDMILGGSGTTLSVSRILGRARLGKARELAQRYLRREPDAVELVDEILASASQDIDSLMAKGMPSRLDAIEQIDRLAYFAEGRRNASLREIDRRRPLLSESLRCSVKEVEEVEFQVIEATQAKGENAA